MLKRKQDAKPGMTAALLWIFGAALFFSLLPAARAKDAIISPEEGQFRVFVDGKEVGQENFSIEVSGDTVTSRSTSGFRNLGSRRQKVQLESRLNMDRSYLPQTYQLRTDVDGQKGTIDGTFGKEEATFEYRGSGEPRTRGLLVGDHYIVLDTNIFHHFIFVVRLFDFSSDQRKSIEVVIPQSLEGGTLKVSDMGMETVSVGGKQRDLHHLRADSGMLQIDLWADGRQTLYKIAVPAKNIEVIRKS